LCCPESGCCFLPICCDDSNQCTNDSCLPNLGCVYTKVNCDDNDECTDDLCDPLQGCVNNPTSSPSCESKRSLFNLEYSRDPCSDVDCSDDDPCTDDQCDSLTGTCFYRPNLFAVGCDWCGRADCDDLNPCTVDTCEDGACRHAPNKCDDGDDCTKDTCDLLYGCLHVIEKTKECETKKREIFSHHVVRSSEAGMGLSVASIVTVVGIMVVVVGAAFYVGLIIGKNRFS